MTLLNISSCVVQRVGVGQHCWNDWVVLEAEGSKREALGG